jgi:hypothetical protein
MNFLKLVKQLGNLAKNLIELLDTYGLRKNILAYVKDEGSNFNNMTIAFKIHYEL